MRSYHEYSISNTGVLAFVSSPFRRPLSMIEPKSFSAKKRPSGDGEISEPSAKVAKPEQAVPPQPSYKSKLNEAVMKMKLDLPTYSTIRTAGGFLSTVVWNGQGTVRLLSISTCCKAVLDFVSKFSGLA